MYIFFFKSPCKYSLLEVSEKNLLYTTSLFISTANCLLPFLFFSFRIQYSVSSCIYNMWWMSPQFMVILLIDLRMCYGSSCYYYFFAGHPEVVSKAIYSLNKVMALQRFEKCISHLNLVTICIIGREATPHFPC